MKTRRKKAAPSPAAGAPFLHRVESRPEKIDPSTYPFNIRAFSHGIDLTFRSKVTFFVGENGSGKSTLLEALAECWGSPLQSRRRWYRGDRLSRDDTLSDHPRFSRL